MKKTNFVFLFSVIFFFFACSDDVENPSYNYNHLEKIEYVKTETAFNLKLGLSFQGYAEYASILKSDVKLYKVSYTTSYQGRDVLASGALFVSTNFNSSFPTIVYTHGTLKKDEAPSDKLGGKEQGLPDLVNHTLEVFLGMALASMNNCAVLLPDYLGYGQSASINHPYLHHSSLGSASLDFIRACAEINTGGFRQNWLNEQVFITGYSEGGYAAVALQKALQESADASRFEVLKVVAGAGAYDQYTFAREFMNLSGEQSPHTISTYLWVMDMYKTDYQYSKPYSEILSAGDNLLLQSINYNMGYFQPESVEINTDPGKLFTPSFIDGVLAETDDELLGILKENSLTDFVPSDSLILIHGTADDWVYPSNSQNAYAAMHKVGAPVKLDSFEGGDHTTTLPYFLNQLLGRLSLLGGK